MPGADLDVWVKVGEYFLTVVFTMIAAFFGLKYGLKDTRKVLVDHIAVDDKRNDMWIKSVESLNDTLSDVDMKLAQHSLELAMHDERTKRTATLIEKVDLKLDKVDEKVDVLQLNQERMAAKLNVDIKR